MQIVVYWWQPNIDCIVAYNQLVYEHHLNPYQAVTQRSRVPKYVHELMR